MAFKGIDIRQTGDRIVFRASLKDSSGVKITSGSASLYVYELQSDGALKSYDFDDNTFKSTALTTETASMSHRAGNNGGTNTGLWTYVLSTLTGFTDGNIYFAVVSHASAMPPQQEREFQFGSGQEHAVIAKLPTKTTLAGTNNTDGDIQADEATGKMAASLAPADCSGNLPVQVNAINTGVDFNNTMKSSINTETSGALSSYGPSKPGDEMDLIPALKDTESGNVLSKIMEKDDSVPLSPQEMDDTYDVLFAALGDYGVADNTAISNLESSIKTSLGNFSVYTPVRVISGKAFSVLFKADITTIGAVYLVTNGSAVTLNPADYSLSSETVGGVIFRKLSITNTSLLTAAMAGRDAKLMIDYNPPD